MRCGAVLAVTVLVLMLMVQPYEASRILEEEEEQWMKRSLLPSFQRGGSTGPPTPSGCTWVGTGGPPCRASVGSRNFAGDGESRPSLIAADAYPKQMARFGVAK